jgi:hypothetical protein
VRAALEHALVRDFPGLFADSTLPPTQSLMCFGCEHGDGWYWLLRATCEELAYIAEMAGVSVKLSQVKEKYGELRVYWHMVGEGARHWFERACQVEEMASQCSRHICEVCGAPGCVTQRGYWLKTLCPHCYKYWCEGGR